MARATSYVRGCGALALALGVGLSAGCGGSDHETAFREATEQLDEIRETVKEARAEVEEHEAVVAEAEAELAGAREALAAAEEELSTAQAEVGLHATDEVLFREVQSRLLDDELLEDLAISARVEKGVVTLSGEAQSEDQRSRAGDIARDIPGVISVDNLVKVTEREV